MCREVTEAERRAKIAEEQRQAGPGGKPRSLPRAERLEREPPRSLPGKEAARMQRLPRKERLAASAAGWRPRPRARPRKSASVRRERRQKPVPASARAGSA